MMTVRPDLLLSLAELELSTPRWAGEAARLAALALEVRSRGKASAVAASKRNKQQAAYDRWAEADMEELAVWDTEAAG